MNSDHKKHDAARVKPKLAEGVLKHREAQGTFGRKGWIAAMPLPPMASLQAGPATISAIAVLLTGGATLPLIELGPLSALMAEHLLLMNVVAPLAAAWLAPTFGGGADRNRFLYGAGIAQTLLLWAWHLPPLQRAVLLPGLDLVLPASLFAVAVLFWALLLRAGTDGRWSAVAALLMTGKLACLLGALLILAPRVLYPLDGLASAICGIQGPLTLADQHLAGLLMVAVCPLSYLVAGVVMTAQMLTDLEHRSADPAQGVAP